MTKENCGCRRCITTELLFEATCAFWELGFSFIEFDNAYLCAKKTSRLPFETIFTMMERVGFEERLKEKKLENSRPARVFEAVKKGFLEEIGSEARTN